MNSMLRLALLCLVIIIPSSCEKGGYKTTSEGLKYKIIRKANGKKVALNDIVQLNLNYYTMADSLLFESSVIGDSFILKVTPPTFKGGFEEGLMLLGEGDSAEFILPADSVFARLFQQPLPLYLKRGSELKFRVGVKKILSESDLKTKVQRDHIRQQEIQIQRIEEYLDSNNIKAVASSPGIYFIHLREGNGKMPVVGDSIEVNYTGKTLSGQIFDSSKKGGGNLSYRIGNSNYLPAWERAVTSMNTGGIARLIITSEHAFGKSKDAPVPPDTPVMFDIELIRIY